MDTALEYRELRSFPTFRSPHQLTPSKPLPHTIRNMPIRNPFAKRPDVQTGVQAYEEALRPQSQNGTRPAFEKVDTMGSKGSSALSISSKKSQEPVEYKMSGMRLGSNQKRFPQAIQLIEYPSCK